MTIGLSGTSMSLVTSLATTVPSASTAASVQGAGPSAGGATCTTAIVSRAPTSPQAVANVAITNSCAERVTAGRYHQGSVGSRIVLTQRR